jgi:hypothetical protein
VTWYKFLASGAIGAFSGQPWPTPAPDGEPGAWVTAEGPLEPCRRGLHLCRGGDLPYWLNEELYVVEVSGDVEQHESFVLAGRARLLRRVPMWSQESAHRFSSACAWRVRDLTAAALRRDRRSAEADLVEQAGTIADIRAVAERLRIADGEQTLTGYLRDAAMFAQRMGGTWAANAATTAFVAASAARAAAEPGAEKQAVARELRRQADWLVHELAI